MLAKTLFCKTPAIRKTNTEHSQDVESEAKTAVLYISRNKQLLFTIKDTERVKPWADFSEQLEMKA